MTANRLARSPPDRRGSPPKFLNDHPGSAIIATHHNGEPSSTVCTIVLDRYATQKHTEIHFFCGGTRDSFRLQFSQLRFIASLF